MTRQDFLLREIALHRTTRTISSGDKVTVEQIEYDGMVASFSYNKLGGYIMKVMLDGRPLLHGSVSLVEEAIGNGYTIKERNNG